MNLPGRSFLVLVLVATFGQGLVRGTGAGGGEPNAALSPQLSQLLDRVEKRGADLKSFQADMTFEQRQLLLDAVTLRHGWLCYQADDQAVRFRIHFADWLQRDLAQDSPPKPLKFDEDFAFDGLWLTRRNERTKSLQRVEITKTAHHREDFRLGKGPFPLPFALRRSDVLAEFDLRLPAPDPNDPRDADHLLLIPKPGTAFAEKYLRLELWLGRGDSLPRQLRYETDDAELTTITWSAIQTDKALAADRFQLKPAGPDWDIEATPLPERSSAPGTK